MEEIYHNIFQETISYKDRHMSPRNLYVIRQPGRSLMVDTSFRFERDFGILRDMVEALGIDCHKLDVFITHDHPDHSGLASAMQELGAKVFMNPEETRKRADLLHCYLADEELRIRNLRLVGVTEEDTPEVYQAIMEYTRLAYEEHKETRDFSFISVHPGQIMKYGEYSFEIVSLKGHTFGQCGLYEKNHKLLFCGDQIMTTIVPIVGSQQKDLGLLKCYLKSLGDMKHQYGDCRLLPCHYGPIEDVEKEANRIIMGYLDKCEIMKKVLDKRAGFMTTRDVGLGAYGRSQGPPDYRHFVTCTQIWAKTFSCLEFMYEEGFVERLEKEGIIYWRTAGEKSPTDPFRHFA